MSSESARSVGYHIDRRDRLDAFNDEWRVFADANLGSALHPSRIRGRVLWDFVTDATTVQFYQAMCQRLRDGGHPIRFRFRCDAPDRRRLLMMEMTGDDTGGTQFSVHPVLDAPRDAVALLDPSHPRSVATLSMCAWCQQVRTGPDTWCEVEAAVEALQLFESARLPGLTHGMCPACQSTIMKTLDDPAAGAAGTVTVGSFDVS